MNNKIELLCIVTVISDIYYVQRSVWEKIEKIDSE